MPGGINERLNDCITRSFLSLKTLTRFITYSGLTNLTYKLSSLFGELYKIFFLRETGRVRLICRGNDSWDESNPDHPTRGTEFNHPGHASVKKKVPAGILPWFFPLPFFYASESFIPSEM